VGSAGQNPGAGPSREQREKDYEGSSDWDRSGYPHPASESQPKEPVRAMSNLNAEGRVGDPLPLLLLAIIVIAMVVAVVGAAWLWLGL